MQHGKLRSDRCRWSIDKLFQLSCTRKPQLPHSTPHQQEARLWVMKYEETHRVEQQKPKNQIKMTTKEHRATRCVICQNG